MNRRDFIKTALLSSPAVWFASKYGLPNGEKFDNKAYVLNVDSTRHFIHSKYAMVASQHNHDFIEILEIISETEIKVRNTEELLNS